MHDELAVVDSFISEAGLVSHLRPVTHFLSDYLGVDSLVDSYQTLCDLSLSIDTQVQTVPTIRVERAEVQGAWPTGFSGTTEILVHGVGALHTGLGSKGEAEVTVLD